jgi:hypothetical protein
MDRFARAGSQSVAVALVTSLALLAGCMTYDPVTGEQRVDTASTATAVAAVAAVGALAYVASRDDDDDDDDWYDRDRDGRSYRPARGIRCYPDECACYDDDGYSRYWTRREFGRRR